ncbi:MAG: patatin-like phospholipase family protein, partial [Nitrospira sp.]|nr:patatin-like phospholipase family protein [Nitrospira sp.]
MTLVERIREPRQKKILALDGGGIRGMITVEILAAIEALLRDAQPQAKRGSFVLADYFDFVAGTSTGAILAACISLGMPMSKIRTFYTESGADMFDKAFMLKRWKYQYKDEGLARKLKQELGADTTLGSDKLRTMLLMVMRNATTDSPWPVWNNPKAKYNDRSRENCNLHLPLWQLVRASAAAPVFFPPEVVKMGKDEFVFVDGGVTTYNNPSFHAFIMATTEPYNLNWATGEDRILIVSVGTGTNPNANKDLAPGEMNLLYNAGSIPSALMFAALNEQDLLCRVFGKCLVGNQLDREVGDLIGKKGPVSPKLFTYMRYNAELSMEGLADLGCGDINCEEVQQLDSTDYIKELQQVGQAVAKQVKPEHYGQFV